METKIAATKRYGMVIDLDKCNGCGSCMIACAVENNIPGGPAAANERTGTHWMLVHTVGNGKPYPESREVFFPILCQQCGEHTPCVSVCPQNAVEVDPETGVVGQIPERCLGCRYCMTACPYHARSFNWWDPVWPAGMEKTLNPDVSPRMRGVVEKCNFCHGRYHAAKAKAAAEGKREIDPGDYIPACVDSCPTGAIVFGDLEDEKSEAGKASRDVHSFRLLEKLNTGSKVYYRTNRSWVRQLAQKDVAVKDKEMIHG
jgi:menaquinone reductase, iron-sulfur cluster-binding subunit